MRVVFVIFCVIFAIFSFLGCSNEMGGHGDGDTSFKSYDLSNKNITERNFPSDKDKSNLTNIYELQKRYQLDCIQEEWFFCPPLNAIWQFKIVTDICKDPPEVLEIGECIEKFECDPSNTAVEVLECVVDGKEGT